MSKIEIQAHRVTLWRIDGNESSDGSGGPATLFVLTNDDCHIPNPDEAIAQASQNNHSWYEINHVKRVTEPSDLEITEGFSFEEVINQSSLDMDDETAKVIASLIFDVIRHSRVSEFTSFLAMKALGKVNESRKGNAS